MRVVVTGSAGRLGRSVCAGLAQSGHEVFGLDRVATEVPGIAGHAIDLGDAAAVESLLRDIRPDAVVHLAGIAVPFSAPEHEILLTNTSLAHTVIGAAVRAGASRVLAASSPTPIGYGTPSWAPSALPIDEAHPLAPANAYALSKLIIEETVRLYARTEEAAVGFFRPYYVISPEEWTGAPTQLGHTIAERLADPALAAVSLFNYVDARDVADFIDAWLAAPAELVNGEGFFVGAADALATRPVSELWREFAPAIGAGAHGAAAADALTGSSPVFSIAKAEALLGWQPRHSWRSEHQPLGHGAPASDTPSTPTTSSETSVS